MKMDLVKLRLIKNGINKIEMESKWNWGWKKITENGTNAADTKEKLLKIELTKLRMNENYWNWN